MQKYIALTLTCSERPSQKQTTHSERYEAKYITGLDEFVTKLGNQQFRNPASTNQQDHPKLWTTG